MHTYAFHLRAERMKISSRSAIALAAVLLSAVSVSACGDSDTSADTAERGTSTVTASPQTTNSASDVLGPLETVDDFIRAANVVGEVHAPCGAQPLQVNECIDAQEQALPLMKAITAAATSKGWIQVVTAVQAPES